MQFKDLSPEDYYRVCKAIEKRATGLTVDPTTIIIDRSGLKVYFSVPSKTSVKELAIIDNFIDFLLS